MPEATVIARLEDGASMSAVTDTDDGAKAISRTYLSKDAAN